MAAPQLFRAVCPRVNTFIVRCPVICTQALRSITTRSTQHTLNTGAKIPAIGFGTFQDPDAQEEAVALALKTGFRHIDTAQVYDTEKQVGKGLKRSGVPREDVFLATKLWCSSYHPEDVEPAVNSSLENMSTPYLDLLLMHYPCTFARGTERFPRDPSGKMIMGDTTFVDTWRAMEELVKKGKVRAIGVSNFSKEEIETLINETSTVPAVHQMECHPYLQQKDFNKWLTSNGIHVTQFSPLGNQNSFYREVHWSKSASHIARVIEHPILKEIAEKHGKSAVQVTLAWGVNCGRSVIPKSVIDWQIKQNIEADFELDAEDMARIAQMDLKVRFNDPGADYQWKLYSDLEGV